MTADGSSTLSIRPADETDCGRLFEWANDPVTRANSFSTASSTWNGHCRWFAAVLRDPRRWLYIVTLDDGTPVGQVRFDGGVGNEAEVSVTIAPEWRGHGLAAPALTLGTDRLARDTNIAVVYAYVKPGNDASRRAFIRAGYLERGLGQHHAHDALLFQSAALSARRS